MKKSISMVVVVLVYSGPFLFPNTAKCALGDTLAQAKSKSSQYERKYGAVAPMFQTDSAGSVIWEGWSAPPQMWSKTEALEFARQLLPSAVRDEAPTKGEKDGTKEPFIYSDGTVITSSI